MPTTKLYRNTSNDDLNVIGVGLIPAGDQVSVTAEFQPPVVLSNYPGLVDVGASEEVAVPEVSAPVVSSKPSVPQTGGQNEQG